MVHMYMTYVSLSLSIGCFFRNGIGLSVFFLFLCGKPMTVFSALFGLPLLLILGGSFTFSRPKHKVSILCSVQALC